MQEQVRKQLTREISVLRSEKNGKNCGEFALIPAENGWEREHGY